MCIFHVCPGGLLSYKILIQQFGWAIDGLLLQAIEMLKAIA